MSEGVHSTVIFASKWGGGHFLAPSFPIVPANRQPLDGRRAICFHNPAWPFPRFLFQRIGQNIGVGNDPDLGFWAASAIRRASAGSKSGWRLPSGSLRAMKGEGGEPGFHCPYGNHDKADIPEAPGVPPQEPARSAHRKSRALALLRFFYLNSDRVQEHRDKRIVPDRCNHIDHLAVVVARRECRPCLV